LFKRFTCQERFDGWCIVDRMTGLAVADASAVPLTRLDEAQARAIVAALAIGQAAGGLHSYVALGRLCVDVDQWVLGPTEEP
jgi:hypothetical protein